jgi:hypothetical protein
MKKPLERIVKQKLYHYANGEKIIGPNTRLQGDCSGLSGDCTGLSGNCSDLSGNCTDLSGNCTGLSGNCTGLSGDLNEIPLAERKAHPELGSWVK